MNPIEQDFSRIQRDVLDNSNFSCPREAMNMIMAYIEKELEREAMNMIMAYIEKELNSN
jgi:hypothetical protein